MQLTALSTAWKESIHACSIDEGCIYNLAVLENSPNGQIKIIAKTHLQYTV